MIALVYDLFQILPLRCTAPYLWSQIAVDHNSCDTFDPWPCCVKGASNFFLIRFILFQFFGFI
jgi:hypothetical protein